MNAACYQHPTRFATATCVECERPICAECTQTVANKSVCSLCVEAIRARVASGLNSPGSAQTAAPSSIPVNVPRATSGIPMSVPRSNSAAPPPAYGGPGSLNTPSAPQPGSPAPYQSPSGAAPLLGGSYAPAAPALDSTQPYPPAPQMQPLYAPPGAQPTAPAQYGQPVPAQPPVYGQPTTPPYNPPTGYGQPANQQLSPQYIAEAGPNITLAVIVGVIMIIVVGGGCGAVSIAIGMRLPFLSIFVGLIVGHAVKAAAKMPSHAVGIIGGVCSLLTCGLTYGMLMLLTTYQPSAIALLLLFYATWRGYRIGSGESSW